MKLDGEFCADCMDSPCHCDLPASVDGALRLLTGSRTDEGAADEAVHSIRLVREYKGAAVADLLSGSQEGSREALPEVDPGASSSNRVVPGPGFAAGPGPARLGVLGRPHRIVFGVIALVAATLLASWLFGLAQ